MKRKLPIRLLLTTVITIATLVGCKNDEEPNPLQILRVVTDGGNELISGTEMIDVPVRSSFEITFDKEIDVLSANASGITLVTGDGTVVPSSITVSGPTLLLEPQAPLATGVHHSIIILPLLVAVDGAPAAEGKYDFLTYGRIKVVPPQFAQQVSYFSFTNSMEDEVGTHTPIAADIRNLAYATDRFGYELSTGSFDGSTTIVEIPNGDLYMTGNSMTMSVWIKSDSTKAGQFVLGLGAWTGFHLELSSDWAWVKVATNFAESDNRSESDDNWFQGNGETRVNGGCLGCTFQEDVQPHNGGVGKKYFKGKWAQVTSTYDAYTKLSTLYINGTKVEQHDFNLWPADHAKSTITGVKFGGNSSGGGNKLALGFIQGSQNRSVLESWADPADIYSNHFKGLMDDLRIFRVSLTEAEVLALYNSEKI
jgi:hypothetical protein